MNKINLPKRLASGILDHFIMTAVLTVLLIIVFLLTVFSELNVTHESSGHLDIKYLTIAFAFGINLYFMKDSVRGRSVGKRATNFQVLCNNGSAASPLRCFIRDIFIIIWPVEFFVLLFSPSRRLGDIIAGTKVVELSPTSGYHATISFKDIISSIVILILGTFSIWCLLRPISNYMDKKNKDELNYIANSYNSKESIILTDSIQHVLGKNYETDVAVYDSVRNSDRTFVSVIIRCKKYSDIDKYNVEDIDSVVMQLLRNSFSKKIKGRIQTWYKGSNGFQDISKVF